MITTLLTRNSIMDGLKSILMDAKEVNCAVAFWGKGSQDMFSTIDLKNVKVVCNLTMGGTNPATIKSFIESGVSVKQNNKLHAKIYLTEKGCIIGSANASVNGLAFEGSELDGWIEACTLISPDDASMDSIRAWFYNLYNNHSTAISEKDISRAFVLWRERRRCNVNANPDTSIAHSSFIDMVKSNCLVDANIYIAIVRDGLSVEALDKFSELQSDFSGNLNRNVRNLDCYEGWDELKPGMNLIDIYYGPMGAVTYGGVFNVLDLDRVPFTYSNGVESYLTLCSRGRRNTYFTWNKIDSQIMRQVLDDNDHWFGEDDSAKILSITELQDALTKSH